jgi:putative peptide zinc metalloprotease protein
VTTIAEPTQSDPYAALRGLRTCLRSDTQITRQSTQGQPVYVVFDPSTFQSFRLSLNDYRVASCIQESKTLQECFGQAVAEGHLNENDEMDFWQFVERLQALGLLTISTISGSALFQRYKRKSQAAARARLIGFLFVTIPLANPDRFLDRTIGRMSFLFHRATVAIWAILGVVAACIVGAKYNDFVEPLNGLLAFNNLFFMTIAFILLKVWHEFGHGYACKHYGGRVTEMGCKLLAGIPLAYVDASSAWSFSKQQHRIMVMLGGMYFELIVAITAAFVWAFAPNSFVGACAYQLIFMAGVATIFFNANPLMKYDGYFILSELLGIPNLRARASSEMMGHAKRLFLGLPYRSHNTVFTQRILLAYGILSSLYGLMLMITIPMMIATRFQVIGLLIAAVQVSGVLYAAPRKLLNYLFRSPEAESVRDRARWIAYGICVGLPIILLLVPVPDGLLVNGVVSAEQTAVIRATTPGIVRQVHVVNRTSVEPSDVLVSIDNNDLEVAARTEAIAAEASQRNAKFVSRMDVAEGMKLMHVARERRRSEWNALQTAAELTIHTPFPGQLTYVLPQRSIGQFLAPGDTVAKVVAGKTIVRAWMTEEQLACARLKIGSPVHVRLADDSWRDHAGFVRSFAPASASDFQDFALTTLGEGNVLLDPVTGKTLQELFQLQISVPGLESTRTNQEARAYVQIGRRYEPIGYWCFRNGMSFVLSIFSH